MSLDTYTSITILSEITDKQLDEIIEAAKKAKIVSRIDYQRKSFDMEESSVRPVELDNILKNFKYRLDSGAVGEYYHIVIVDQDKVVEDYTEVCHYNNDSEEYYWVREETRV